MPSSASPPPVLSTLSLHDALPIWLCPLELPRQDVGRDGERVSRVGRHPELPAAPGGEPADPHQARHALATRPAAAVHQFGVNPRARSEEHTSELQSHSDLVCRLLLRRPPCSPPFPYTTLFRSGSARSNCRARTLGATGNGCREWVVTRNCRRRRAASPRTRIKRATRLRLVRQPRSTSSA